MFRHEVGRLAWFDWNNGRYWADDDLYVATPAVQPGYEKGAIGLPPGPPGPGWFTGGLVLPLTGMDGYRIQHSRWIGSWEDFDFEINPGYATYNAWMADEVTDPFKVYDKIQWVQDPRPYAEGGNTVAKGLTRLRFLYDTSADYRGKPDAHASVPDMIGYLRTRRADQCRGSGQLARASGRYQRGPPRTCGCAQPTTQPSRGSVS